MPKIPKELQNVILQLPTKEKDKLLLRLIAKNELLTEQLYFQLLEDESDLKQKREEIKEKITRSAKGYHESPGWMMMAMRDLNGLIAWHVKVTKDKYGEVELTLFMLKSFFEYQEKHLQKFTSKSDTLALYVAKRTDFLVKKASKLHEDYHIEFDRDINQLLKWVHTLAPSFYATQLNIPKEWE